MAMILYGRHGVTNYRWAVEMFLQANNVKHAKAHYNRPFVRGILYKKDQYHQSSNIKRTLANNILITQV